MTPRRTLSHGWRLRHPVTLRRLRRRAQRAALLAGAAGALWLGLVTLSPWPPILTLKHLAAFPDCRAARRPRPARDGEPGYWPSHDADRDGIACEPRPRW